VPPLMVDVCDGDPVAVRKVEGSVVIGLVMADALELLDVVFGVGVAVGAISKMLDADVCTINVAVIVPCVLGNALAWPLHIEYASATTASMRHISTTYQKEILYKWLTNLLHQPLDKSR
jgi:hypothetical protein